jgi:DNA-binding Xre family transcriptional regulator
MRGGAEMITYEPFYRTLKEREISTYRLINQYGISRSLLDRLKHNKPISTVTLNDLCCILDCRVEDILCFLPEEKK